MISAYFDAQAVTWDEEPYRLARAEAVAAGIRRQLPLNSSMNGFEFGCGTGLLSFCLQADLGGITLADTSPAMLEVLKGKLDATGSRHMRPWKLDQENSSFPAESFDLVYSLMTFHHIEDIARLLGKLRALLKSCGYLCVADLDREDGSFHNEETVPHHGFDRNELKRLVCSVGFRDVVFETVFEICKSTNGVEKSFPVFLMIAQADTLLAT